MIRPKMFNIKTIWKISPAGPANDRPFHLSLNTSRFREVGHYSIFLTTRCRSNHKK